MILPEFGDLLSAAGEAGGRALLGGLEAHDVVDGLPGREGHNPCLIGEAVAECVRFGEQFFHGGPDDEGARN